jgi:hypothetical protein
VSTRVVLRALLPFLLHALAREVDAACGLLLHTSLDLPAFVPTALGLVDPVSLLAHVVMALVVGALSWGAAAAWRRRRDGGSLDEALRTTAGAFAPLYLRPALTLAALASLAVRPTFPYGFTLPVALTQDWGPAQDALAAAAVFAGLVAASAAPPAARRPGFRLGPPRTAHVVFVAFVVYALLTPAWARRWEGHPGNEPKYLRMAVALGHALSLDVEGVDAPMEELEPQPLGVSLVAQAGALVREAGAMAAAIARGPDAVGRSAITATRITRQTIRGKDGGVFHVLAPGPSLLLAPTLRIDRALNRAYDTTGRLAVTVLTWNLLAALLVTALFVLVRDATGSPGLAALLSFGFGLLPPFLFYFFQFYPEMLGALVLGVVFRLLLLRPDWARTRPRERAPASAWALGLLIASLPWLHQKFLPVWLLLGVMAVAVAVDRLVGLRTLLAIVVPSAISLAVFAFYNFAITGSVRPDALFLAWGPGGVTTARVGQGLLGLALDARYGLLPYVPVYLLAGAGLFVRGATAASLRWALPAAVVYYLTVASADNWSGAVCNLGRYVMPIAPLGVVFAGLALAAARRHRGVLVLAVALAAWSGLVAFLLWRDPHAANDGAVLLAKSAFADGNVYLPNLFIRNWADGAPGLGLRVAVWLLVAAVLALWVARASRREDGGKPVRTLVAIVGIALVVAFVLERWPSPYRTPRFGGALSLLGGVTTFVADAGRDDDEALRVASGSHDVIVRSDVPQDTVAFLIGGDGFAGAPSAASVPLRPSGTIVRLAVTPVATLTGRRGARETLGRATLVLDARAGAIVRAAPALPPDRPE